jgi:uncharacterized membrane protein
MAGLAAVLGAAGVAGVAILRRSALVRPGFPGAVPSYAPDRAVEVLKDRYARGELGHDEFLRHLDALLGPR